MRYFVLTKTEIMRIIGTDVSLKTCKNEGYLMLEFDARKKFDPYECYRVFNFYPDYCVEENKDLKGITLTDTVMSAKGIWEIYQQNKKSIDRFIGMEYKAIPSDHYELLSMTDSVNAYMGLP